MAMDEKNRRKMILAIQADEALSPQDKARKIQQVMMSRWLEANPVPAPAPARPASSALEPTFADDEKQQLGCKHYRRGCKLRAACCNELHTCRFCHDEASDHAIDRYATHEMLCMHCSTLQPVGQVCNNDECGKKLAHYYCEVCKFWSDDPDKDIYHCPKCRICRVGKGLGIDYFHCDKCNACMAMALTDHRCIERNLESNCPICGLFMFTSTTPVVFMNCGHCMHSSCLSEYSKSNYTCPICSKSLGDMTPLWREIDQQLSQEQMPREFRDVRAYVLCNDCETKSETPYHFVYNKCQSEGCGSYNTKLLSTHKAGAGPPTSPAAGS